MPNYLYSFTDLSMDHADKQYLRYASSSSFGDDWSSIFHSHDCTELFYVTSGEGIFCTEDGNFPVQKNDLIIINAKVHHTERSSSQKKMQYLVLGIENLQFNFNNTKDFIPFRIFSLSSGKNAILPLLQMIFQELQQQKPSYEEICQHCLAILLLQLQRITGERFSIEAPTPIPYECEKIKSYIETHFHETITLDLLAKMVHWDKFYFSHQFSQAYGISPINFLLEKRIQHSKQLLATTDYSITLIAEQSGFSSPNYFTQAFKKSTGCSPREYRQKYSL